MPKFDFPKIYKKDMEEEPAEEIISLEDTLQSLKRNAQATEIHFQETLRRFKQFQKRLSEETHQEVSQRDLQPRTRMMKWLTERGLPVECSFQEFFERFLEEHKQDHRLDLSRRTIHLNPAACVLFHIKEKKPELHILDLLEKLPLLYV
jgi:hypothetical protein